MKGKAAKKYGEANQRSKRGINGVDAAAWRKRKRARIPLRASLRAWSSPAPADKESRSQHRHLRCGDVVAAIRTIFGG